MSFDWNHYLDFAETILKQPAICSDRQAALRAGISRAYYSAYWRSRDRCTKEDPELFPDYDPDEQRINVHAKVIKHFCDQSDRVRKALGKELRDLKANRVKADYRASIDFHDDDLEDSIDLAKRIIYKVETLDKQDAPPPGAPPAPKP